MSSNYLLFQVNSMACYIWPNWSSVSYKKSIYRQNIRDKNHYNTDDWELVTVDYWYILTENGKWSISSFSSITNFSTINLLVSAFFDDVPTDVIMGHWLKWKNMFPLLRPLVKYIDEFVDRNNVRSVNFTDGSNDGIEKLLKKIRKYLPTDILSISLSVKKNNCYI